MNMKGITKLGACALMLFSMAACSDKDEPANNSTELTAQEAELKPIVEDYVNCTVVPTYRALADATIKLAELCDAMCEAGPAGLTEDQIKAAGDQWIAARKYWELSEAWLFGPADIYSIDPHIDTWPLDKTAMNAMLNNAAQMALISDRESAANFVNNLGQGLLGFHAIEYMLFEPANETTAITSPRPASRFTQNELYYLAAVADDLRNCCVRLEASWTDEGTLSAAKAQILEDAEMSYDVNYGSYMKNAGQSGSLYKSYAAAVQELIVGAQDIADEVGNQKIGNPIGSGTEADPDYIESPYALNSITDFTDNIRSVRNAYMGYQTSDNDGETYLKPVTHSLSAYIRKVDPQLDTRVREAPDNAIQAIQAMREPFASTSQQASYRQVNLAAVEACNELMDILDEVIEAVQNN